MILVTLKAHTGHLSQRRLARGCGLNPGQFVAIYDTSQSRPVPVIPIDGTAVLILIWAFKVVEFVELVLRIFNNVRVAKAQSVSNFTDDLPFGHRVYDIRVTGI